MANREIMTKGTTQIDAKYLPVGIGVPTLSQVLTSGNAAGSIDINAFGSTVRASSIQTETLGLNDGSLAPAMVVSTNLDINGNALRYVSVGNPDTNQITLQSDVAQSALTFQVASANKGHIMYDSTASALKISTVGLGGNVVIAPDSGETVIQGNLDVSGNNITCGTLNYTTLNPPVSGSQGATGATGSQGPAGVNGVGAFFYSVYESSGEIPGAGEFTLPPFEGGSQFVIDITGGASDPGIEAYLRYLAQSPTSITLYCPTTQATASYAIAAPYEFGGSSPYWAIPIIDTIISPLPFTGGDRILFFATNASPLGTQGEAGPTGLQGATGLQGEVGATGLQGGTGPTGLQGATGSTGLQGTTGSAGVGAFVSSVYQGNYTDITLVAGGFATGDNGDGGYFMIFGNTPAISAYMNYIVSIGGSSHHLVLFDVSTDSYTDIPFYTIYTPQYSAITDAWTVYYQRPFSMGVGIGNLCNFFLQGQSPYGSVGATGLQGATGPTGLQGEIGATGLQGSTGLQGEVGATGLQGSTGLNGIGAFVSGICINGGTYIVPPGYFNINSYGSSLVISSTPAVDAYMTYAATRGYAQWSFVGSTGDTFSTPFAIPPPFIRGSDPSGNVLWELPQDPMSLQFLWSLNDAEQYNLFLSAVSPYGATGLQGPTGSQGEVGATGAQGDIGATGAQGDIGATGATGDIGATGATGAQGATGPFSTPLANKIEVVSASDVPTTALTWTSLSPTGNTYVPLSDSLSLAPIAPSSGTGWRMTKATSILATAMTIGQVYTINTLGTTVWASIGWNGVPPNGTGIVGQSATYTGGATGTGTVCLTSIYGTNISWYPLNSLYTLSLPQGASAAPPIATPSTAIKKKDLNAVWALVRFNNDIAQQGYFSLTVETYAYQYGSNTTNNYTGRWAYSLPSYAVAGGSAVQFNAGAALTTTMPRAVGGFTYLLYIEDKYPKMLPNLTGSFQVSNGMFPSQSLIANTCRDPYDIYPEYQHFPLNAVQYSQNATQPAYGGSSPYADQADVEVASIYFKTTQSPNAPQTPQPALDFQVLAMGYRGDNDAHNYTLAYDAPSMAIPIS